MPTALYQRSTARFLLLSALSMMVVRPVFGWGREGHMIINTLAIQQLPADAPGFLKTPAAESEITYLGPEPDRWRSPAEQELNAMQSPEHFIDLEFADMVGKLPRKRYEYIAALYAAGVLHPEMAKDLRPERAGLLPYQTIEVMERLQAAFRSYRELKAKNMDTAPVEQAAIFYAGWLGHYAGDGSMPLHVTENYNGWVMKDNPHGYVNDHKIHSRFETAFVERNIKAADVAPFVAPLHVLNDPFEDYMAYLRVSQSNVERLYQLDLQHGFEGAGSDESRKFTEQRIAAGASMLRDLIETAWLNSAKPLPPPQD